MNLLLFCLNLLIFTFNGYLSAITNFSKLIYQSTMIGGVPLIHIDRKSTKFDDRRGIFAKYGIFLLINSLISSTRGVP